MTTHSQRCLKLIIFVFNAVFAIGGLVSLICGGVALAAVKASDQTGLIIDPGQQQSLIGASALLLAIGVFVFITAILGCIAAMRENRGLLLFYAAILVIILILQFAAAVAAFVLKSKVGDVVHDALTTMQNNIRNDTSSANPKTPADVVGKAFEAFQKDWKCCGVSGPQDWIALPWFNSKYSSFANNGYNVTYPGCCFDTTPGVCVSCSTNSNVTTLDCVATKNASALYTTGCQVGLSEYLKGHIGIVAGVAASFAVVQLLGIILSCCLARSIGNVNGHQPIGN